MPTERKRVAIDCGCVVLCDAAENDTMTNVIVTTMCDYHENRWISSTIRKLLKEAHDGPIPNPDSQ